MVVSATVFAQAPTSAPPPATGPAPVVDAKAEPIVSCMRANVPKTVQIKDVELTARDRSGGERLLRGRLHATNEKDRIRAMLKIGAPPDLAGAAYLVREGMKEAADEIYVFVPALNKVRRVTGGNIDGPLWGTDLSYSDLKQIQNAFFNDGGVKHEGRGEIEKAPVDILYFTPRPGEASRYSGIRTWVEQKSCIALKAEFFEGTVLRKRLTGSPKDLMQSGPHWYLGTTTVADLKEGTQTRIKVTGVSAGKDLADRYFNPGTFYVGN